jgi:hypothetical protein
LRRSNGNRTYFNTFAFNGAGVAIDASTPPSTNNDLSGNTYFANTRLDIDLDNDGPTPNDPAPDADTGANLRQNFPVLTAASSSRETIYLRGTLTSAPNRSYRIGFHRRSAEPPANVFQNGPVGFDVAVTTDADGRTEFSPSFSGQLAPGDLITATATDADGNTSEFSEPLLQGRPLITGGPYSQSVFDGQTAILAANFAGQEPLAAQWRLNGVGVPGATNRSLIVPAATSADAGTYTLVVSNALGVVTNTVATLTVTARGPLDRWAWRNPLPQGNDLNVIGGGNGVFVAAGQLRTTAVSRDGGLTWGLTTPCSLVPVAIAHGNGLFVMVGGEFYSQAVPRLQTSPDGVNWTERSVPGPGLAPLEDVVFGDGRFVVTGQYESFVSTNGIDWERRERTPWITRLTYGNGLFVGFAAQSFGAVISTNGLDWTYTGVALNGGDIAYGDGRFVVCSSTGSGNRERAVAFASTDATNWTRVDFPNVRSLTRVAYGNGRFVAVGGNNSVAAAALVEGTNWVVATNLFSDELRSVAFDGNVFAAVGDNGVIVTSSDGTNWANVNNATDTNLRAVTRGDAGYVAVGNGGLLYTSPDATNWVRRFRHISASGNWHDVEFARGRYVAIGGDSITPAVSTSTDATNWTPLPATLGYTLYGLARGNGLFVAVGEGSAILTSPDGLVWTRRYSGTNRLNAVTWGNGTFVAVGRNGTILTSPNGATWTLRGSGAGFFQAVAYGGGVFVAGTQAGYLFVSSDAASWTPAPNSYFTSIEDLTFGNGVFLAVGANGLILASSDAANWAPRLSQCVNTLRGAACIGGSFLVVGNNETILQSDFIPPSAGSPLVVTSRGDSGPGSLRDLIACAAPGGVIHFSAGLGGTITLTGEELRFDKPLTLRGPGAGRLTLNAQHRSAALRITGGPVTISDLTVENGGESGAVVLGPAMFSNVVFRACWNPDSGGGARVGDAALPGQVARFIDCTFDEGEAAYGSGLSLAPGWTATLLRCTVTRGLSSYGAIFCDRAALLATNSFISSNRATDALHAAGLSSYAGSNVISGCSFVGNVNAAPGVAGAFLAWGRDETFIRNSTFSGNQADYALVVMDRGFPVLVNNTVASNAERGLLCDAGGVVTLRNCIIAGNGAGPDVVFGGSATPVLNSLGHNLIGSASVAAGVGGGWSSGEIIGTEAAPLDPRLSALGLYGGSTPVHVPRPDSPAVNAGDDIVLIQFGGSVTNDQRGGRRPFGAHVDIGAVEAGSIPPRLTGITVSATQADISFTAEPGWPHRLESKEGLAPAVPWGIVPASTRTGAGTILTVPDTRPRAITNRFYRALISP